ncbi:hypothetical protein JG688_00005460 [Phytophthora aleatoria]|uniref:DUF659 domain-containing protein n=1 Tax=Phytophthora aleatoria TaxID=2496075 RepID=A0A8J5J235_9STRA|nr:hypothetical protein JG688_00005460 [Phytophthora aleatoria]
MWLYSTGMAFSKAAHPALASAVQERTPTEVVPSRKQLATTLLNSCYYEARSANVLKLRGKKYTLVTDAWMDTNGQSVIYYVALDEELAIFLESDYSESISHDALYLAGDIRRVMGKYSFICFVAVATDNTAANRLVWTTLPWLKDPEQNCRQLVRFLKKNQQLWYESRRLQQMDGKTTLVLPVDTHWEAIERCFKSIKSSETILHGFVNSRDFLRSGSKEQKAKRRHAHDMKAFQKNSKPPSEVYRMFLQLPKIYAKVEMTIAEYGKIARILDDRFNFIYVNVHGVAYLLDPRYLGRDMAENTRRQVDDFITACYGPDKEYATAVELVKYLGVSREGSRESKLIDNGQPSIDVVYSSCRYFAK